MAESIAERVAREWLVAVGVKESTHRADYQDLIRRIQAAIDEAVQAEREVIAQWVMELWFDPDVTASGVAAKIRSRKVGAPTSTK
jgi:hypothetical protein